MLAETNFMSKFYKGAREAMGHIAVMGYRLEGSEQDEQRRSWGFFGIYSKLPLGSEKTFIAFKTGGKELSFRRALQLQLPEIWRGFRMSEDPDFTMSMEEEMARLSRPSILLVFDEVVRTKQDGARLYCIAGVSPSVALAKIQTGILEASARRN